MAAQTSIPLSLPEDPERMRSELVRALTTISAYFSTLTGQPHAAVVQPRLKKRAVNDPAAAFGFITPVSLPNETDSLDVKLPRPDPRNAGLWLLVRRDTTTGVIRLSAPGCFVNGSKRVELVAEKCAVPVFFDGENYFTPPAATWAAE